MEDKLLLGIDIGTTNIKCILYDIDCRAVANLEYKNTVINYDDGRVEQDMNLLWNKVSSLIKSLIMESSINPLDIKAIGLTGQGEGCWLVDQRGNPIGNAILWSDCRAQSISNFIEENTDLLKVYRNNTGSHPFSGAQIIILKWLSENEPKSLENAKYLFFCKDWIRFKLTNQASIEYTDASTSILDLRSKKIAEELFNLLKIENYKTLLPKLKKSTEIGGYVTEQAAKITGLKAGTPVVTGLMDIVATVFGTGAADENHCCTILGTTCCNEVVTSNFNIQGNTVAGYELDALNRNYINVMATMAGTPNIDWFIKEFLGDLVEEAKEEKYNLFARLEREMEKIGAGSGGIIYHPYISEAGERAPFVDSNARAQFFGMSSKTTRYQLLRAIYEGIAYSIRDCLDSSPNVDKIYLTGGGAKSRFWAQIISDVTGKRLYIVEDPDPAARGAALIAGLGIGIYSNIESMVIKVLEACHEIIPKSENHSFYTELYKIYKKLRKNNISLWKKRSEIMRKREALK